MTKARCNPLWQPIPCPLSDIEGLESWLGDMAAQGLVPVTIGQNFARFRCSQPKAVRYRLNAKPAPETFLESAPGTPDGEERALAQECGWSLNLQAATALFTGMVTDSGRFRYDATNARTFRLASYLMEQPIDTNALYRNLYASDYAQLVVRAKFLLHVQFTEKNVAYVYTTMDGKAEYGVDDFTLTRGMVNSMADMRGGDIWVTFTESDKGVMCELRSSRFNINPIAVKYGGGGHMKASGATLKNREEAMAMLHDLDEMMGESK